MLIIFTQFKFMNKPQNRSVFYIEIVFRNMYKAKFTVTLQLQVTGLSQFDI